MKGYPGGGEKQVGVEDESSLSFMELDKGALGTVKGGVRWAVGGGLRAEKGVWVGGAVSMKKAPKALGGVAGS